MWLIALYLVSVKAVRGFRDRSETQIGPFLWSPGSSRCRERLIHVCFPSHGPRTFMTSSIAARKLLKRLSPGRSGKLFAEAFECLGSRRSRERGPPTEQALCTGTLQVSLRMLLSQSSRPRFPQFSGPSDSFSGWSRVSGTHVVSTGVPRGSLRLGVRGTSYWRVGRL